MYLVHLHGVTENLYRNLGEFFNTLEFVHKLLVDHNLMYCNSVYNNRVIRSMNPL